MTDFNTVANRTRTFEGFLQFQDPGVGTSYFRLKERQSMNITFNFNREGHYSDDGIKVLDPAGHSHSFSTTLKQTVDLYDTVFSNSSTENTLSYWIYKSAAAGTNIGDQQPVEAVFVSTQRVQGGGDYIHWKFTLSPQTFTTGLGASGGTDEITINGEVISIESVVRSASATPPA